MGQVVRLEDTESLARKYLTARGVTSDDVRANRIYTASAPRLSRELGREFPNGTWGIVYPYFGLHGEDRYYVTARIFWNSAFGESANKEIKKLLAPVNKPLLVYYPPMLRWEDIPSRARVYICESVLKAIVLAKRGLWAVGLNGVYGYSDKKVSLKPSLMELPWEDLSLEPVVCYDSNLNEGSAEYNEDVWRAAERFSAKFRARFPNLNVWLKRIPNDPEEAGWGVDDFLVSAEPKVVKAWLREDPEEFNIDSAYGAIHEINSRICMVEETADIATKDGELRRYTVQGARNLLAPITYVPEGGTAPKLGFEAWLRSERRSAVERIVYEPMKERFREGEFVNSWNGFPIEPSSDGDGSPFFRVAESLFKRARDYELFIEWCAHLVQNPGVRMTLTPVLCGPQGVGKSMLANILTDIFGQHSVHLGMQELTGDFNSDYASKCLVVVEEGPHDVRVRRGVYEKLKRMITTERVPVHQKGRERYYQRNTLNWLFITNEPNALPVDVDDRRFFMPDIRDQTEYMGAKKFWHEFVKWRDGGGAAEVMWALMQYDLSEFYPHAPAPRTETKSSMHELSLDPIEAWISEVMMDWRSAMKNRRGFYLARELEEEYRAKYHEEKDTGWAARRFGMALKKLRVRQLKKVWDPSLGYATNFWLFDMQLASNHTAINKRLQEFPTVNLRGKRKV